MNRDPAPIPHASQAIEDLLKEASIDAHPQNWLLSYLDVFMLIVMLMITLSALTEINKNQVIQTSEQSKLIKAVIMMLRER